jgi:hypothetical protein
MESTETPLQLHSMEWNGIEIKRISGVELELEILNFSETNFYFLNIEK